MLSSGVMLRVLTIVVRSQSQVFLRKILWMLHLLGEAGLRRGVEKHSVVRRGGRLHLLLPLPVVVLVALLGQRLLHLQDRICSSRRGLWLVVEENICKLAFFRGRGCVAEALTLQGIGKHRVFGEIRGLLLDGLRQPWQDSLGKCKVRLHASVKL